MAGFLFGAGTDTPTAAELQRKRQRIDALQQVATARTPRNVGEGIAAIGQALAGRIGDRRLAEKENAERARAGAQFDSAFRSATQGVTAALMGAMHNGGMPAPGASSKSPYPPVDPVEASRLPMPVSDVQQIAGAAIDRASQPPQAMVDAPQMAPPAAAQSLRVVDPQMTGGAGADALQGGPGGDTLGNPMAAKIVETAQALGIDPVDLATAISYETAGTFDPTKAGPTTQWGQHRGLIQFGEPQAAQYGVDWNDPLNSQLGAEGAIAKYLRDTGVQPGMGLMDIYSAINAGGVGRYNASDAHNGGAPGTVRDKVAGQMDGHRAKAAALLGGEFTPGGGGSDVMMGGPGGDRLGGGLVDPRIITQLAELAGNPYLDEGKRMIAQMLIQQQLGGLVSDPMKQLQMQKAQLEIDRMQNPPDDPSKRYRVVGNQLVDLSAEGGPQAVLDAPGQQEIIYGPDGKPILVRGSGKLTEAQSKDNVFATRAEGALATFEPVADNLTSFGQRAADRDPTGVVRGSVQSPDFQIAMNAGNEFLQAILRKDTGAAITAQEQVLYGKTYLPQPGDGPAVLEAKRQARARAVEALKSGMSIEQITMTQQALIRAAERTGIAPGAAPGQGGVQPDQGGGIQPGTVEDGWMYRGGDPADPESWVEVR